MSFKYKHKQLVNEQVLLIKATESKVFWVNCIKTEHTWT